MNEIGGERGGIRRKVDKIEANIEFPLRRPQGYSWVSKMYFLTELWVSVTSLQL